MKYKYRILMINIKRQILLLSIVGLAALVVVPSARPQAVAGSSPAGTGPDITLVKVEVDGKQLFDLRGMRGYPASRRAREVGERIAALGANPKFSPESLTIIHGKLDTQILDGDDIVIRIFDADGEIEGLHRDILADIYLLRIKEAIGDYRRDRTSKYLIKGAMRAGVATLIIAVVLFGLLKLVRWLGRVLERRLERHVKSLEEKSHKILRADRFLMIFHWVLKVISIAAALLLTYTYLQYVLGIFPWTRAFGFRMLALITDPLANVGKAIIAYIPKLVFLIILIFITRYLIRALRLFFDSLSRRSKTLSGFDPDWAQPTFKIVRIILILLAVVLAYPYIPGSSSDAFKGISIFIGVIFSLGSTSVIANIMAGYTMIYRRAFKVGDRVRINDAVGDVTAIRLLVTHIRSLKNEEIILPNSIVINSQVINYSALARSEGLILHTTVGIGYEVPWRQVEAMLLQAAERTPGLLEEPAPFVLQTSLGDYAITYELNAYCGDAHNMIQLYSELRRKILDLFNEYGVAIMTPSYVADTPEPKVVPKNEWYQVPAKLADAERKQTEGKLK
jgi:small-conductance mechanosensitive channel